MAVTGWLGTGVEVSEGAGASVEVTFGVRVNVLAIGGAVFVGGSVAAGVKVEVDVQAKELNKSRTEKIGFRSMPNTIPLFSKDLFRLIKL